MSEAYNHLKGKFSKFGTMVKTEEGVLTFNREGKTNQEVS